MNRLEDDQRNRRRGMDGLEKERMGEATRNAASIRAATSPFGTQNGGFQCRYFRKTKVPY